jgi:hypothetical protein
MKVLDDHPPVETTATAPEVEALFPEAKRRERHRRLLWLGAVIIVAGAAAGIYETVGAGRSSTSGGRGHLATPAQLHSFISRADRGVTGAFAATYQVTALVSNGHMISARIFAAQRPPDVFSYQVTPELLWPAIGGSRTETFWAWSGSGKHALANAAPGIYVCNRAAKRAAWSCGNDSNDLMGGQSMILDNYPPYGFNQSLQDATYNYTSLPPATPLVPHERAYLTTMSWRGQNLSCLDFGSVSRPVAYACLNSHDLIALYSLPLRAGVGDLQYNSAMLISYSRTIPRSLLTLPATPTQAP